MDSGEQNKQKKTLFSIRAVAFDLDETLFSRRKSFQSLLLDWVGDQVDELSLVEIIKKDEHGYFPRDAFFEWLAGFINSEKTGETLKAEFMDKFPDHIRLQSRNSDLLSELEKRGYSLALLSNGSSKLQRKKLKATGLEKYFPQDRIFISGELNADKPDPSVFLTLAKSLGYKPSEILYVGDHWENDVKGSEYIGMKSAWVSLGRDIPSGQNNKVLVIDDLYELLAHLPCNV